MTTTTWFQELTALPSGHELAPERTDDGDTVTVTRDGNTFTVTLDVADGCGGVKRYTETYPDIHVACGALNILKWKGVTP